ncbi:MAG: glutamate--cysteine ligase [Burkholderiales bacterium]|nr:glutamate--cysteine ligase [Burkholderiales bacterium]MDE2625912.1 glutamate--cysteine ligase [Burkholderiales bacterium]
MALGPFGPSQALSLGVELELQLVNTVDFDLTSGANDLLELLSRKPFPGTVTPEMTQSMIEIATSIQTAHAPLLAELRGMRDTLVTACDRLNIGIAGGGTHPFQRWSEQRVFSKPRFEQISQLYGYLAKQFTVFGQHVHVGCASGDDALFLLHALNRYVPQFIALSASSPYSQGVDTLFDSARLNSVFAFPLSGRAPFTLNWDEFANGYFTKMEATGVVKSMKDFYWDIRPKPEYGTIELRVCDTPLTVERAAALACYLQAICRRLLERTEPAPTEDDYLVYTFNRFQACRFGLDGTMVDPHTRERRTIREDTLATLRKVEAHGAVLQSLPALEEVERCAARDGNHATHLRKVYSGSRNVQSMVQESARVLRSGAA